MNKWLLDRILHVREFLFVYDCAVVRKICSMKHLSVKLVKWSQRPFFTSTSNRMICSTSKIGPSKFQNTKNKWQRLLKKTREKKSWMKYISILQNIQAKFVKGNWLSCTQQRTYFYLHNSMLKYILWLARVCVCMRVSFFVFCSSIELILFIQFICCVSHVILMRR